MNKYQEILFKSQDKKYKEFSEKLIIDDTYEIIGVRAPRLKAIAKENFLDSYTKDFMNHLPHKYHEENILHVYFIDLIVDYDLALEELCKFLPYANNWAVTDAFSNKNFMSKGNRNRFYVKLLDCLKSEKEYTIRYGIVSLLRYLEDNDKIAEILKCVLEIEMDTYYINMAKAWLLCEAMIKQHQKTIVLFEENKIKGGERFSPWIQNKAISKCVDSFRISDDIKKYLKTLKLK